jgi:hypothetical protein
MKQMTEKVLNFIITHHGKIKFIGGGLFSPSFFYRQFEFSLVN